MKPTLNTISWDFSTTAGIDPYVINFSAVVDGTAIPEDDGTSIPEPASVVLLGLNLAGLGLARLRRRA